MPNLVIVLSIILSFVVAQTVGTKRRIGFVWSLLFCLSTSVLIGYFITCLSSKKTDPPYTNTKAWHTGKLIAAALLIGYGASLIERILQRVKTVDFQPQDSFIIMLPFTLIMTGIYLGWYTSTKQYNMKYEKETKNKSKLI
ncbi:MAG: hypothetical protein ABIR78_00800 [Ferruginibacter sp.]